jgi:hypothetical protein
MGARAPSDAAAAVARAFETASRHFASDVASRSPRTARGSGAAGPDPGGPGDSGDDIVDAPRRFEGDAPAEPPDASGPATASFASPGGHHVGFIQYHPPVAASAEGVYAPALERARRAFGMPSSSLSDAESVLETVGDGASFDAARVRDGGGSRRDPPFGSPIGRQTDDRSRSDARSFDTTSGSSNPSGGIFLDTAHAFGSRANDAASTRSFRWRSLVDVWSLKKLARLPLDFQTRFAGSGVPHVSLWDLEVGVKLGGGSPSVEVSEVERRDRRRPKTVPAPALEKLRRFLSRRFAKWNPSFVELETTPIKRLSAAAEAPPSSERAEDTNKVTLPNAEDDRSEAEEEKTRYPKNLDSSSVVLASRVSPSAFVCAHLDGWGDRCLEFELAGGKSVRRKDEVTGSETCIRTRRSWTASFDLTGNSEKKPTVEWVDVTEKDETEFSEKGKKQFRERRDDVYDEKNENSGAVRSTTTRVRLAYRSPLKFAGLHPVIRALEMGRHRHLVNDRAAVEVRRVRSPVSDGGTNKKGRPNEGEQEKTRRQNVSDVLDARLAAEARPSLLRMTTRWRKARTFDTTSSSGELKFRTTYAVTHEGIDTLVPRVSHEFAQKASFEANVVASNATRRGDKKNNATSRDTANVRDCDDGASFVRSWRGSVRVSSRLRSARETPSVSFSCAREGARWTVSGETRFGRRNAADDASESDASEIAFRARRESKSIRELGASVANHPNRSGFVEVRLSLSGGDARAFAEFATSVASSPSRGCDASCRS